MEPKKSAKSIHTYQAAVVDAPVPVGSKSVRMFARQLRRMPKTVQQEFDGLSLTGFDDMNGALIHDIGVVYAHLSREKQVRFDRELREVVNKYWYLTRGIKLVEDLKLYVKQQEREKKAA